MGLNILQIVFLLSGIGLSVFSSHPLGVWMGLELNLFSFLPLLLSHSKCSLQYFVAQTMGTLLFLLGKSVSGFSWVSALGFCVKIGVLPYYSWFIEVVQQSSWGVIWLLSCVQKIHLLVILSGPLNSSYYVLMIVGALTVLVLSAQTITHVWWKNPWNQIDLKGILGVLSMLDGGVLITALSFNLWWSITYFTFYSLMLLGICFSLGFWGESSYSLIFFSFFCLNLMGFPPLLGFFAKVGLWCEIFYGVIPKSLKEVSPLPFILLMGFMSQFLGYTFLFLGKVNSPLGNLVLPPRVTWLLLSYLGVSCILVLY